MAAWNDLDVHLGFDVFQGRNFYASNLLTTAVMAKQNFWCIKSGNTFYAFQRDASIKHVQWLAISRKLPDL